MRVCGVGEKSEFCGPTVVWICARSLSSLFVGRFVCLTCWSCVLVRVCLSARIGGKVASVTCSFAEALRD